MRALVLIGYVQGVLEHGDRPLYPSLCDELGKLLDEAEGHLGVRK